MLTLTWPVQTEDRKALKEPFTDSFYRTAVWDGTKWVYYHFHYVRCPDGRYRYVHGGNDLHGPRGSHLVACYPGKIVWVNEGLAFGNHQFKIVDAFGREYHYKHTLSRPANGIHVSAGTRVALLGDEGTSAAHLHFEIRSHNDKNAVINPRQYLLAAESRAA
jgi:murein DD-endopeptidase MepM/ murein hydrolase activator NlpD